MIGDKFKTCDGCNTTAQCRHFKLCYHNTPHIHSPLGPEASAFLPKEPPSVLPTDPKSRKDIPVCTGVLDYFPLALVEVAKVSLTGNIQHNGPDSPLHWARGKSMDFADTIIRHMIERGGIDTDGQRHTAKAAWRILAMLQIEMEQALKQPISRGSKE